MLTVVSGSDYEMELREASERIVQALRVVDELRARRDHLLRRAVREHGFSERRAASAASVSPSYAHRVARKIGRR
jgi:hypothetical protein